MEQNIIPASSVEDEDRERDYQKKLASKPRGPQPFNPDELPAYRQALRDWEASLSPEQMLRYRLEQPAIIV